MLSEQPARKIVKAFKSAGWRWVRTEGSHSLFMCACGQRTFVLPDGVPGDLARCRAEGRQGTRGVWEVGAVKTYEVTVRRDGRWWMVAIPELDGLTQARRLDEVELMAREYIALAIDVPLSQVGVDVSGIDVDGRELLETKTLVDGLRRRAMDLEALVAALSRDVAAELTTANVPVRDVSSVLGVSHQRVSQLVQAAGEEERAAGDAVRRSKNELAHDLVVQLDDGRSLVIEVVAPKKKPRAAKTGTAAGKAASRTDTHGRPRPSKRRTSSRAQNA